MYKVKLSYGKEKIKPVTFEYDDHGEALSRYIRIISQHAAHLAICPGRGHKVELIDINGKVIKKMVMTSTINK